MRINHNIAALNTHRQLGQANQANQNTMEKLSSGLRINNASDDAAGLAISEKMRGQIRGLEQAQTNAQDGISMIQTAEGALNETHDILQRMRELAVQSSNDTNTDTDRAELQKEVDQLSQELSRIGDNTEFNTQNLLDGSFEGTFQIGANEGQNLSLEVNDMRGFKLGMAGDAQVEITDNGTNSLSSGTFNVQGNDTDGYESVDTDGEVVAKSSDGGKTFIDPTDDTTVVSFDAPVTSGTVKSDSSTATTITSLENKGLEAGNYNVSGNTTDGFELSDSNGNVVGTSDDGISFKNSDSEEVLATTATVLGDGASVAVGGIDISNQEASDEAVTKINDAIESVSAERSKMGAYQNRLEHTINNLGTSSENLTAAESRIRDVDMAKEMMNQTKQSILSQASQAMLAKANQQPQGVLQLLR
ncbi:flagellin N-terminal helical domain-containing protein [Halobacillus karajensis]|uniref:Flagellin n=1 Tax=Halobacillus karajensis TaxID=195088 RepID=A0A059NWI3_9BACI|nr:flagellin [Halobacillus karajensis]CDQ19213.1 Flagellin D [Halobacillus karajensis]CDQ22713.1 Flagellin D [Halobacillus karajensis]CDQ26195.1 Flagellin D [Halobacillus karajensis]